ncbi:hypothetical protein [Entomospira culicis]|uniref:Outer membrane protein beta-barrel domain-containing protein n=1 Tax=Entomospira culicis TaxID=2719989 RepID=A0A968GHE6_9SPIO|nr:hypothetical protein [Entomospira culicis]NIZ18469.1 hypothetical protein [Entomospira culicis]NIZ68685.1 hypothetical protein [Entomospira culicis]WDI37284.1 hypothetical protein PVA46_00395 [Entomospira culicis]WDI38913.1 hypothetical protein PVA47_00405 [Entomospira culicis]
MKSVSKFLLSSLFVGISLLGITSKVTAFEVGLGMRAGVEASFDVHWAGDQFMLGSGEGGWNVKYQHLPFTLNFTGGFFADFRFGECNNFAISPGFNFAVARRTTMDIKYTEDGAEATIKVSHSSFDLEVLAKFFLGIWYVGVGPGVTINTAPIFKDIADGGNFDLGRDFKQAYVGMNFVLDTGFYIPLGGYDNHNIMIGWRTAVDVTSFYHYFSMLSAMQDDRAYSLKANGMTLFSTALSVGYVYRFIN